MEPDVPNIKILWRRMIAKLAAERFTEADSATFLLIITQSLISNRTYNLVLNMLLSRAIK